MKQNKQQSQTTPILFRPPTKAEMRVPFTRKIAANATETIAFFFIAVLIAQLVALALGG